MEEILATARQVSLSADRRIAGATTDLLESRSCRPVRVQVFEERDLITVVAGGRLTRLQRALLEKKGPLLTEVYRATIQDSVAPGLAELIESETGRNVTAYLCDQALEQEVEMFTFLLGKAPDRSAPRTLPRHGGRQGGGGPV